MRNRVTSTVIFPLALLLILSLAGADVSAQVIPGGDLGGQDLIPGNGAILSGTFTNVGTFQVNQGVTVLVDPGVPLSITAGNIIIVGTLDGTGSGEAGGPAPVGASANGLPGSGPGGGEGGLFGACVHGSGGGGGGYGGTGGNSGQALNSPPPALGGPSYGSAVPPGVLMGSGGGSAANHCDCGSAVGCCNGCGGAGGAGGAAISLLGGCVDISGSVLADGEVGFQGIPANNWSVAGGGGGSGGGIEIIGQGVITGTISAAGGDGADYNQPPDDGPWAVGGGGGAGGRIKLSSALAVGGATLVVTGGTGGISRPGVLLQSTDGAPGTTDTSGGPGSTCGTPPTCVLTGPAGVASADVDITLDSVSPNGPTVDVAYAFSLDAGNTWTACTAAPGSPLSNPALAVPNGISVFQWDTHADGLAPAGVQAGVLVRATVDDGVVFPVSCDTAPFDVDNTALCWTNCGDCDQNGIATNDIIDALTAAQIAALILTPTPEQMGCCDVDGTFTVEVLDALVIAQDAALLPVTLDCP